MLQKVHPYFKPNFFNVMLSLYKNLNLVRFKFVFQQQHDHFIKVK